MCTCLETEYRENGQEFKIQPFFNMKLDKKIMSYPMKLKYPNTNTI